MQHLQIIEQFILKEKHYQSVSQIQEALSKRPESTKRGRRSGTIYKDYILGNKIKLPQDPEEHANNSGFEAGITKLADLYKPYFLVYL